MNNRASHAAPHPSAAPLGCPSCRAPMAELHLPGQHGRTVTLDLCHACRLIWFDPQENLRLAAEAVVQLLNVLHAHRDAPRQPLATALDCPRCARPLTQGFDVVRHGRYITWRCGQGHGRLATFSSFMVEKGFVRHLTPAEVDDIARRVGVIHCASCGAPVNVRQDAACPHCRSALALLDPGAVERALAGYAQAAQRGASPRPLEVADALIMIERDRQRVEREDRAERHTLLANGAAANVDLWAAGVEMVWRMLR